MRYWLAKTEPGSWSWADQVKYGETGWDGVRNYQASNNLKAMELGDWVFFYHSISDKAIVGIVEVCGLYRPDPTDETGRFGMTQVKTVRPLKKPVTLEQIKAHPELQNLALIRQSRLSVMPVSPTEWEIILALSEK
jgi:predicted RNA-binding protein with PUA-like domain